MTRMDGAPARPRSGKSGLADSVLVDQLVQQILQWRAGRDRYLLPNQSWLPKWRFNPVKMPGDALRLLDGASPVEYTVRFSNGQFRVTVRLGGGTGRATSNTLPRGIVLALAQALKLEVVNAPTHVASGAPSRLEPFDGREVQGK